MNIQHEAIAAREASRGFRGPKVGQLTHNAGLVTQLKGCTGRANALSIFLTPNSVGTAFHASSLRLIPFRIAGNANFIFIQKWFIFWTVTL